MINPNPPLKSYTELRNDLLHLADEFNKHRLEIIDVQKRISEVTTQLVMASDAVFPKSLAERTSDGELKKEFKTDTDVQAVADYTTPSRRNCSLCGQPGHRKDGCPDADKALKAKKETATLKAERKEAKAALKGTGKRACSNCHKPGHRVKNCPEPVVPKKTRRKK